MKSSVLERCFFKRWVGHFVCLLNCKTSRKLCFDENWTSAHIYIGINGTIANLMNFWYKMTIDEEILYRNLENRITQPYFKLNIFETAALIFLSSRRNTSIATIWYSTTYSISCRRNSTTSEQKEAHFIHLLENTSELCVLCTQIRKCNYILCWMTLLL